MSLLLNWLDEQTGCRAIARKVFCENIPGGARWRYTWGSAVLFLIFMQVVTGITLWLGYSPSAQTAWESVNYLQNDVTGGWILRGLHHYTAQILPVMLALHLMQVVIDGAYKAPREVNFWSGLLLMQVVLLMALTGYQLPWDQKGFWATKVAMNILGIVPVIGKPLQTVLIGGPDYGQLTLTRFFGIHAGILPATLFCVVLIYFYLSRRNGFAGNPKCGKKDAPYWPDQVLRNAVVCLAVVAALLFLIFKNHGAPLSAPADPSEPFSAARPEWYFLFLYQFLKLFPAQMEIVGALIIPGILAGVIFLMPFFGRTAKGQKFNVGFLACVFAGVGLLASRALYVDAHDADYLTAVAAARAEGIRANELAHSPTGVPAAGVLSLLRDDAKTQGPKLFARNCASCHRYGGSDGTGRAVKDAQSASDLKGFGSREWLAGLLDPHKIDSTNYFGGTKFKTGKMVKFVKREIAAYAPEQKAQLLTVIATISAEAGLKSQIALDRKDAASIARGKVIMGTFRCTDCHKFHTDDPDATAPELTGYGSKEWLVKFLGNPGHGSFYGARNDRMPAFEEKKILTPQAIGLIADWLRGDWYEPEMAAADETK